MVTHDGCDGCFYEHCKSTDLPCKNCKGTAVLSSKEYERRSDFYTRTGENVNHPAHYNNGSIECIDAMVSAFGDDAVMRFCKINAFKYIWRADHKNGAEDIKKAVWYLNKYVELAGECNEMSEM